MISGKEKLVQIMVKIKEKVGFASDKNEKQSKIITLLLSKIQIFEQLLKLYQIFRHFRHENGKNLYENYHFSTK
ncbi:hypothetical protein ES705_42989 [subsurface metagenome]